MTIVIKVGDILPVSAGHVMRYSGATDVDPGTGGPDTSNPLLNDDGTCAINPEWVEPRSFGPGGGGAGSAGAVLASEGPGGRQTRAVHERHRTRRVTLTWANASGVDIELVRRALQATRSGAGSTRFRHPMLDPPGDVASAPLIRFPPQTVKIERTPGGTGAKMAVEIEYVE